MVVQPAKTGAAGGGWRGHYVLSFKFGTHAMFGDINVGVWVEETVWSPGERSRLEIRCLSGFEPSHTDLVTWDTF